MKVLWFIVIVVALLMAGLFVSEHRWNGAQDALQWAVIAAMCAILYGKDEDG